MKYTTPANWPPLMTDYAISALTSMKGDLEQLASQNNQTINVDSWTFKFQERKPRDIKGSSNIVVLNMNDHELSFTLKWKDQLFRLIVKIPDIEVASAVFMMCLEAQSGATAALASTPEEVQLIEASNSDETDTSTVVAVVEDDGTYKPIRFDDLSACDFHSEESGELLKKFEKTVLRLEASVPKRKKRKTNT